MLHNFTFSKDSKSTNYYCSKKLAGCKARVKLDKDGKIMHGFYDHTHPPPSYIKTASGQFVKLGK